MRTETWRESCLFCLHTVLNQCVAIQVIASVFPPSLFPIWCSIGDIILQLSSQRVAVSGDVRLSTSQWAVEAALHLYCECMQGLWVLKSVICCCVLDLCITAQIHNMYIQYTFVLFLSSIWMSFSLLWSITLPFWLYISSSTCVCSCVHANVSNNYLIIILTLSSTFDETTWTSTGTLKHLKNTQLSFHCLFSERTVFGDVCASVCEHVLANFCAEGCCISYSSRLLFLLGCLPAELNTQQSGVVNEKWGRASWGCGLFELRAIFQNLIQFP